MDKNISFAVIGGDLRQTKLVSMLIDEGHIVKTYGFDLAPELDQRAEHCQDLVSVIDGCDCIVLGLPYSNDGLTLNAPLSRNPIALDELYNNLLHSDFVVGGKLNDSAYKAAGRHGFKLIDYLEREELAVLNAIPTAEGAIQIAMEELPITIHNSKCLIIGYGRIGKLLSKDLKSLGADVTVSARKHSDLAWINAFGYKSINTSELKKLLKHKFDIIYNTVPHLILDNDILKQINKDCLIIDLASKPGGVDLNSAGQLGLKVIWALSLPGKVAPITSGEIIKSVILNILSEEMP